MYILNKWNYNNIHINMCELYVLRYFSSIYTAVHVAMVCSMLKTCSVLGYQDFKASQFCLSYTLGKGLYTLIVTQSLLLCIHMLSMVMLIINILNHKVHIKLCLSVSLLVLLCGLHLYLISNILCIYHVTSAKFFTISFRAMA